MHGLLNWKGSPLKCHFSVSATTCSTSYTGQRQHQGLFCGAAGNSNRKRASPSRARSPGISLGACSDPRPSSCPVTAPLSQVVEQSPGTVTLSLPLTDMPVGGSVRGRPSSRVSDTFLW